MNKKKKTEEKCTKHSINPVPLIIFDPKFNQDYSLKENSDEETLDLSMIASTNFILMGQKIPTDLNSPLFKPE